ncbi:hypothetical protein [Carboxylicivirga caseinilyticus]|uniref:hypothetical protein n=1 Tax=Carboxylicivirga caseinilyticus TaxID=3417572 RepID=UPI003D33441E|nr:hypothetical protein [Marinilabiliaceae bacterium A049]
MFSDSETAHFRNYSQNDTICFCDSIGNVEKIVIQSITGSYSQTGLLDKYTDLRVVIVNNDSVQDLFTISKSSYSLKSNIAISFKGFVNNTANKNFEKVYRDTILLNGKQISNYYRIENESKEHSIKSIIWTDLEGMTAYQLDDNRWMTIK